MLRIGPNATGDENSAINIREDNQRVGIQKDPTGEYILDVSGAINCDAIFVSGTQFTGSSGGGGVWTEDNTTGDISYGGGNVFIGAGLDVSGELTVGGDVSANAFYGDGSNLTGISWVGTADSDLNMGSNNITDVGSITATGTVTANSFAGDGSNLTGISSTITASRVCVSDTNGNLTASAVSTTDLILLEGINSSTSSGIAGGVIRRGIRTEIGLNSVTTDTHNGISNCSVKVVGAASNQNNLVGVRVRLFAGDSSEVETGYDFDGAYIGLSVDWDVRMRHGYFQSDDRCKHFERETSNCLDKIMALKPKTYVKTRELYDADFVMSEDGSNRKEGDILTPECGFIAQEVAEAGDVEGFEELRYSVTGGDYEDEDGNVIEKEFLLNYNNLFCLAVGAIKELKLEVETLKTQIAELTSL
jgi:hypothetical protein